MRSTHIETSAVVMYLMHLSIRSISMQALTATIALYRKPRRKSLSTQSSPTQPTMLFVPVRIPIRAPVLRPHTVPLCTHSQCGCASLCTRRSQCGCASLHSQPVRLSTRLRRRRSPARSRPFRPRRSQTSASKRRPAAARSPYTSAGPPRPPATCQGL